MYIHIYVHIYTYIYTYVCMRVYYISLYLSHPTQASECYEKSHARSQDAARDAYGVKEYYYTVCLRSNYLCLSLSLYIYIYI